MEALNRFRLILIRSSRIAAIAAQALEPVRLICSLRRGRLLLLIAVTRHIREAFQRHPSYRCKKLWM
ncbi:MAG: hypothetical protein ABI439_12515, partial [Rhodospirillales bacterium]